jgi:4a-hydroxytetrahydrobiopterin dehydratase
VAKLSPEQIREELSGLKGWKHEGDFLVKSFKFKEFMEGIGFINKVAKLAERLEHHPDIHVRWTTVRLEVQSHDEGGVTKRDIRLVRAIEKAISKPGSPAA